MNSPELFEYNANDREQYVLRAKLLGSAIPATSFAAGANALDNMDSNAYQSYEGEGWPRRETNWFHSDLKDVAFYFNSTFFKKVLCGDK